ncbi:flavodoxin family protein [Candidatus Eisenbacteria bacterium]|uniref:Flavodoxin family protein n=1 Tax=Eiseniibacteriota bacterium TaxID=2212470 RepID=A0ABV6YMC4_UNCEI
MKVLTVYGGPHKQGNTATTLGWVEEELGKLGHQVDRVDVAGKKISGCAGCYACQGPDADFVCVQKDDATPILARFREADAYVFASPLYMWGFSGQTKVFLDRLMCQVKGFMTPQFQSTLKGKPVGLVVSCGGPVENNAELILEQMNRMGAYAQADMKGHVVAAGCQPGGQPSEEFKSQAVALARSIGQA